MQLKSIALSALLLGSLHAQDSVSLNYIYYDEDSGRTTIKSPHLHITKEFGTDYVAEFSYAYDSVSGASPTFYDAASGASAKVPKGVLLPQDIVYGDIPYEDQRRSYQALLTKRLPQSRDEITLGWSFSKEHDYISREASLQYLHYTDRSKNRSLTFGISYQLNHPKIYCFLNTGDCDSETGASVKTKRLEVISTEVGMTQILTKTSLVKGSLFFIGENGYLSNPYMRVVRYYDSYAPQITPERKPSERQAYGLTIEYKKAFGDIYTSLHYRLYHDDWDITSHTITSSLTKELTKALLGTFKLRLYTQSEAEFYSGAKDYFTDQKYASSDRRISSFSSTEATLCLRYRFNDTIAFNVEGSFYHQKYFDAAYGSIGVEYRF
ncbi:MAG: DUF3570 domain-containing protein [Epsilonproteobacteria bacterium]|nr:DUF3570 domain-containing protein [Campylobacterota bacterium]